MALTPSTMIPLGTLAPSFELPDVISGKKRSLKSLKSEKATVVMFICNHCPFVKHVQKELVKLAEEYIKKGISFVAINANDPKTYAEDAPDKMREIAKQFHYPFPYLFDETQDVAKAYHAACTPDFFVFNRNLQCVYRGQMDDSRPGNDLPVTGKDLRTTLDHILEGIPVSANQKPSLGCNIKWK